MRREISSVTIHAAGSLARLKARRRRLCGNGIKAGLNTAAEWSAGIG